MKIRSLVPSVLTLAFSLAAAGSASAAIVLNDTFTSGENPGWTTNNNNLSNPLVAGVSVGVVTEDTGLDGNALLFTNTQNNRYTVRAFDAVTLVNIGDSISFSLDYRFPTQPASVQQGLHMGLFGSAADLGIRVTSSPGGGAAPAGNGRVGYNGSSTSFISSTFLTNNVGMIAQSVTVTYTRTGSDELTLTWNLGLASPSTQVVSETSLFTFDRIFVGAGAMSSSFYLDNIVVTSSLIPEPSSAALLVGLGALAFVGRRRRRR